MIRIIFFVIPSVLAIFLLIVACRPASNTDSGNFASKEVMLNEPPPIDMASPPPPTESDALKRTDDIRQYKSENDDEPQEPQKEEIIERKIIKTGDVRFKTKDLDKTRQAIINAVSELKGYVSEESQTGDGNYSEMHLTVRVPVQYFDSLMSVIGSNAEYFDSKNIHTQDVTEEFIDVTTRIKTKKSLESQYLSILKQAKSIKEIMEVRRELNTVREEIESAEGRLRYLSSQVSYSTLTLVFYKQISGRVSSPRGFWSRMGDGLVGGWATLQNIIIGLVSLWPILLVLSGLFLVFRRFWTFRKKRKETPQ